MKKIIGLILFTVFFCLSFQVNSTYAAEIDRINGNDRYQTAVEISQAGWQKSSTVILAKGSDFPDALAGGPLAYSLNAPILLTNDKGLPNVTKQEIIRLGATKVILLGSEGAISNTIEDSLESMGVFCKKKVHSCARNFAEFCHPIVLIY
ncbi:cell wall-binding repeat-containing protein, partial [Metabacillus niabensis]|uniref:cell wall-binding repeat-containing protein n=1 Tax=Metabacillus niabensis TaxID=324854 RepID=UPI00399F747C